MLRVVGELLGRTRVALVQQVLLHDGQQRDVEILAVRRQRPLHDRAEEHLVLLLQHRRQIEQERSLSEVGLDHLGRRTHAHGRIQRAVGLEEVSERDAEPQAVLGVEDRVGVEVHAAPDHVARREGRPVRRAAACSFEDEPTRLARMHT